MASVLTYPLAKVILDERFTRPLWMITLAVLGTLAITISAKINIPFYPVPMTMQAFVILVIGTAYGVRLGGATVVLYLAQGAMGLPVFAGTPEKGIGLAYMIGPTGGYLLGFLLAAIAVGWLAERGWSQSWALMFTAMVLGTVIIYIPGIAYLASLIGLEKAINFGFLPFVIGDLFKIGLAATVMPLAWVLVGRNKKKN
jgi:biotin transport system substrate-specific component